jgi:hypothetical protein
MGPSHRGSVFGSRVKQAFLIAYLRTVVFVEERSGSLY